MSFIKTVRTQLKGRRRLQFIKEVENSDEKEAVVLRRIIDFYFEHHKV